MIGYIIRDRYRILDQIAEDRLATTYLARDQTRNEMVIVKVVRTEYETGAPFFARFRRAAEKLARLTSPQAVQVVDSGQDEHGIYVVFDYVGGKTLAELYQAQGTQPVQRALDISRQIGLCLLDAQAGDMVHGDVRPANILLANDGQVKLMGFGLAVGLDLSQLIADGKLERDDYDAPELALGRAVDSRADLYSLGVVLFEILTGRRPATENTHAKTERRPSQLQPDLPPELDDLVACCLAQDPGDRPQNPAEFLEKLDEAMQGIIAAAHSAFIGMEDALVGHTLGPYRLVERLGRGGMATVYKAYEPSLDRYVAIKVLPQHFVHDPEFLTRFRREAKAIARLNHPNIVPVFNFGEEGDLAYIAMRYVEGGTLKNLLGRPIAARRAVKLVLEIARALNYAHRQGIVHRDVKPANVLMAEADWPLLSDFGLAQMMGSSIQLTQTGVGVGTPAYMSPEQAQGLKVDGRTDIYSLGILLYEMLTGQVPFQADTPLAIVLKHISAPLPLPRQVNPDVPEPVERVILKATAKAPIHRYQTADEMIEALDAALAALPAEALPVAESIQAADTVTPSTLPSAPTELPELTGTDSSAATEVLTTPARKLPIPIWALSMIGIFLVVALAAGAFVAGLLRFGPNPTVQPAAVSLTHREAPTPKPATLPMAAATPTASAAPELPKPVSPGSPPERAREIKSCTGDGLGPGLCIRQAPGTRPTPILKDAGLQITGLPSWSPDGSQIAFSALKPGGSPDTDNRIYIVNVDGSGLIQLPPLGNDISPAWSPDGEWLAFHSNGNLAVMHPDGADPALVWQSNGRECTFDPQWAPDSRHIAVSMQLGGCDRAMPMKREVWVLSRDGAHITIAAITHTSEDCIRPEVAFSPDGRQVAYYDDRCKPWTSKADGSGRPEPLVEFPYWWTAGTTPQWGIEREAPPTRIPPLVGTEGKIVELCGDREPPQICVRKSPTGQVVQVTRDLVFDTIFQLAWSPDGKQIIFDAGSDPQTRRFDHKIYVIDAGGLDLRQVTSGDNNDIMPAWSPDGGAIAFHRNCDLWLMRPDGSDAHVLARGSEEFCALSMAWSPDSQQIALVSKPNSDEGKREIHIIDRDGTGQRIVHPFAQSLEWANLAWSPDGRQVLVWYRDASGEKGLLIEVVGDARPQAITKDKIPWPWFPDFWPQWGSQGKAPEAGSAPEDAWGQVLIPPGGTVKLAFVGTLSRDAPQLGEVQRNASLMAIEDVAIVKGFPIEAAVIADGGCTDEKIARQTAEDVASNRDIAGVIGHSCSASCTVGADIYEGAHLVMISPSCTGVQLSERGYQIFNRVAIREDQGGEERNRQVVNTDVYRDFAQRYQERYGQPLDSVDLGYYAAYAYDATMVLIHAIERTAILDPSGNLIIGRQRLSHAVRATAGYQGVTGRINFDERGDRLP